MRYRLYGLVIESSIQLQQAAVASADSTPDITVTVHTEPVTISSEMHAGHRLQAIATMTGIEYSTVCMPGGDYLLRFHGLADFWIDPGLSAIEVYVDHSCDFELAALLITGNVLSTVLTLRGETVLHASVIEYAGRSVCFVGHSGMGKSTVAALCCSRGATFVSDDVARLRPLGDGSVSVWPGTVENRLRMPLTELVPETGAESVRTSVDGRHAWRPSPSCVDAPPLVALVVPLPDRENPTLRLEALPGPRGIIELTKYPRLLGWLDPAGKAAQLRNLAWLIERVPVHRAHIPWGPPFDPAVAQDLLSTLAPSPERAAVMEMSTCSE